MASAFKPPRVDRHTGGGRLQRTVVETCLAQVLPNAVEVAGGSTDAAQVHQLRIGLRRLRTALRELGGVAEGIAPGWENTLADAFRRLGAWQDPQNLAQKMQPALRAAGGPEVDLAATGAGGEPPGDVVRTPALQAVLASLAGFVATEGAVGLEARHVRALVGRRLDKLHRQVVQDGRRFATLAPEAQHRVRKRLKRLRYLAEFTAPLFGSKHAGAFLGQLKPAQDALGRYNDEAVALAAYTNAAAVDPRAWFAIGWLAARRPAGAEACRRALHVLSRVQVFWPAASS
ncbi:MAG: CHAD domain-containing protein [Pseudomonadota bacterium]